MNKLFLSLVLIGGFFSCQLDDIKNTYTISGYFGLEIGAGFGMHFPVSIASDDLIVSSTTGNLFHFDHLEEGKSYTVKPLPNQIEGRSGISTLDWVSIDHHIKGLDTLSIFQRIAADVNLDNVIDETDLALITECIVTNKNCPTWRFVSEDYNGLGNGYIDQYTVAKLFSDHHINFIPIKLGDVNGTIAP